MMNIRKKTEIRQDGIMIAIYGESGVGKTTSCVATAEEPVLYIATEPRSLGPSLDAANRPEVDLEVAEYSNFSDLMAFITNPSNTERYKTIIVDSLTHLAAIGLAVELEDEAFDARTPTEKERKPLVSRAKLSLEGYGGLSSLLFRFTTALGRLAQYYGKVIVCIMLLAENPKWNRALAAAPALKGREYPVAMPGFFDLVGLCQSQTDENGKIVYPPLVKFSSPQGDFVAKYTGKELEGNAWGPLNLQRILERRK